ncbi:MAG: hypothetical protein MZW92_47625 [Comamonadaceae bacterium]|nr:hypothetical protein [Comamonadaceae bacterium]
MLEVAGEIRFAALGFFPSAQRDLFLFLLLLFLPSRRFLADAAPEKPGNTHRRGVRYPTVRKWQIPRALPTSVDWRAATADAFFSGGLDGRRGVGLGLLLADGCFAIA